MSFLWETRLKIVSQNVIDEDRHIGWHYDFHYAKQRIEVYFGNENYIRWTLVCWEQKWSNIHNFLCEVFWPAFCFIIWIRPRFLIIFSQASTYFLMIFLQHSQNCLFRPPPHWPPDIRITNSTDCSVYKMKQFSAKLKMRAFQNHFSQKCDICETYFLLSPNLEQRFAQPKSPPLNCVQKSVYEPPCQVKFHPIQLNWKIPRKENFYW